MKKNIGNISKKLESGFFGFWVKKWRFTFVMMALIIAVGLLSVIKIPKESSPDIEFGIISIGTVYQGANPEDIDNLVTDKIEQEIKDIEGIKKITSTSVVGFSSIVIELENDVDSSKALTDVKDAVDKVDLPSDTETPSVTEISSNNENMFTVLLHGDANLYSNLYLLQKARNIKANLDGKGSIVRVDVGSSINMKSMNAASSATDSYDINVYVDKDKLELLGINLLQLSQILQQWNKNQPLGSHQINQYEYDFRIAGDFDTIEQFKMIPIATSKGFVYLKDIARVEKKIAKDIYYGMGGYGLSGQTYVSLTFNKKSGSNIFDSAKEAKLLIEEELSKYEYTGLSTTYINDMAKIISQDYDDLVNNFLQSVVLVFVSLLFLVGVRESLIAAVTFPLALLVTFFVLDQMGLTLNFLTNFSFLITFSIAVDTTIVIIEGANEKIKLGFNPKNAILLTVKEYKGPLITATITNVVVFLPMLMLPGIMGKFLAYIPITIFSTLLAALFIGLTVNSALYFKVAKKKPYYTSNADITKYMTEDDLILLEEDKKGKKEKEDHEISFREKVLNFMDHWYEEKITWITSDVKRRFWVFMFPIIGLLLSFVVLSPIIGFKLFPDADNGYVSATLVGRKGLTEQEMVKYLKFTNSNGQTMDAILAAMPEIDTYSYAVSNNTISLNIQLIDLADREDQDLMDAYEIESYLDKELAFLSSYGLKVDIAALRNGPPGGKEVGIKLIADSNKKMQSLIQVSRDFEKHLRGIPGTKNIGNSAQETPGQFVYRLDVAKLTMLGLTPGSLYADLYSVTNGRNAGTLKSEFDNHDVKLKYAAFATGMTPSDLDQINLTTSVGKVNLGDISTYTFTNAISAVSRENGKVSIVVDANLEQGYTSSEVQNQFNSFAESYTFPDGISFQTSGENQENADLINAMLMAFMIAIFMIFAILVFQLNSYMQPLIIMYSIAIGLFGANLGLFLTNNPYSIMFGIGFISLTGIIVNDSILCLYRINENLNLGMDPLKSIRDAGKSRLQPIVVNVLAATLGLVSVITDGFWQTLAVTIIFGLLLGSFSNLFVLPCLFYDKQKLVLLFKRAIYPIVHFLKRPLVAFVGLILFSGFFGLGFLGSTWFSIFMLVAFVAYGIWHFRGQHKLWIETGSIDTHNYLGFKVVDMKGKPLTTQLIMKRFLWFITLLVGPWAISGLLSIVLGGFAMILGFVVYLGLFVYNFYLYWTRDNGQLFHDKLAGTQVIYYKK